MRYLRAANVRLDGLALDDISEMDVKPEERRAYLLREGDVVIVEGSGSSSQVGRAAIWPGGLAPCSFQNHLIRFRPHATTPGYALTVFRYYMVSGVFAQVARGIGIQHLGSSRFARMNFPLPPLREQERIAREAESRLHSTFAAEQSLRSALAHIDESVSAALETAVGGHSPKSEDPQVKRSGKRISVADVRQPKLPEIGTQQRLFSNAPSGNRLPHGWTWITVGEAGEVKLGRQRSPKHERGSHMRSYLRVANVFEDRIDTSDVLRMNFSPQEHKIYRLLPGDILLNEGQSPQLVGRPALYNGDPPNVCFQNTLIRFRAAAGVNARFALLVFRHYFRAGRFTAIAQWSTNIAHLGAKRFAGLPFPLPPLDEQERIAQQAERQIQAASEQRSAAERALSRIGTLRHEILTAALSGRLVPQDPDAESALQLIERLGAPREIDDSEEVANDTGKEPTMESGNISQNQRNLPVVLRELGGKAEPERLFVAAGFDADDSEDIEAFYIALRVHFGQSIRHKIRSDGEIVLEAIDNAS